MYRIISGKWKAKKIAAPKNFEVRPTTDFAKEALFSILEHRFDLEFCSVLDLFAGIGSITLEFASRDCQDITGHRHGESICKRGSVSTERRPDTIGGDHAEGSKTRLGIWT